VAHSSSVLETDSNNLKALYRRGLAYQAMKSYREAHADLSKVIRSKYVISPDVH
jgi:hypothetical protein